MNKKKIVVLSLALVIILSFMAISHAVTCTHPYGIHVRTGVSEDIPYRSHIVTRPPGQDVRCYVVRDRYQYTVYCELCSAILDVYYFYGPEKHSHCGR